MHTVTVDIEGITPLKQSRGYTKEEVPPIGNAESDDAYERRTWRNRCHADADGNVFIPARAWFKAIVGGMKYLGEKIPGKGSARWANRFLSGVLCLENVPIGKRQEDAQADWVMMPSCPSRMNSGKVMKSLPTFPDWKCRVTFEVVDDLITEEVFARAIEAAGKFNGIGSWTPRSGGMYGRFEVKKLVWK